MSLLTFNPAVAPDSPVSKKVQTRLNGISFGDGYSQTVGDGINCRYDELVLSWSELSISQIESIESFLKSVPVGGSFLWTAPRKSESQKWKCPSWTRTYKSGEIDGLSATFKEDFNLDD